MWYVGRIGILIWLYILSIEDCKTHKLPVQYLVLAAGGILIYLAYSINSMEELISHMGGAAMGVGFLIVCKYTKEQLGYGDGIVLLLLGIYLGFWDFIMVAIIAFGVCFLYVAICLLLKKIKFNGGVAFVPFLAIGYSIFCSQNKSIRLKGSATIEILYIIPVIFLIFIVAIYLGFFFHDKNVLQGLVYEATIIGSQQYREAEEIDEDVLQEFIQSKCVDKLLFFPIPMVEITVLEDELIINTMMEKYNMEIEVEKSIPLLVPEIDIRTINILGGLLDGSE